jgi:hypothetical protein
MISHADVGGVSIPEPNSYWIGLGYYEIVTWSFGIVRPLQVVFMKCTSTGASPARVLLEHLEHLELLELLEHLEYLELLEHLEHLECLELVELLELLELLEHLELLELLEHLECLELHLEFPEHLELLEHLEPLEHSLPMACTTIVYYIA